MLGLGIPSLPWLLPYGHEDDGLDEDANAHLA